MKTAYDVLFCQLRALQLYNSFPHYLTNSIWFSKKVVEHKMCVLSFTTFLVKNTSSHSKKNSTRYCHKCAYVFTQSTCYSCFILMKLEFSQQIFKKCSNIKCHKNLSSGSWAVPCSWKDIHDKANSCFTQVCKHT